MDKKQRFFIYDRRELLVLVVLALLVAGFAFTLGVHLGKQIYQDQPPVVENDPYSIKSKGDAVPSRPELVEQMMSVDPAVQEALSGELYDEVAKTGIELDTARQMELPGNAKSQNKGATTPQAENYKPSVVDMQKAQSKKTPAKAKAKETHGKGDTVFDVASTSPKLPVGDFTLQVGSFPSLKEAIDEVDDLERKGVRPFMRSAIIKDRGRWYRVYVGGYPSKDDAEKAAKGYISKHVIKSYFVSQMPKLRENFEDNMKPEKE